ncbi:hypothetical protein [Providencia hangzhouensis]|uniref:hypothetical protein n=1 Tax=Providencia hangzhouensis TaxID=3031799 RepID=UPI0034DD14AF
MISTILDFAWLYRHSNDPSSINAGDCLRDKNVLFRQQVLRLVDTDGQRFMPISLRKFRAKGVKHLMAYLQTRQQCHRVSSRFI